MHVKLYEKNIHVLQSITATESFIYLIKGKRLAKTLHMTVNIWRVKLNRFSDIFYSIFEDLYNDASFDV